MSKKLIIFSSIALIAIPIVLLLFFFLVYPQIRLSYYKAQADERIAQVTSGELEYLDASYTWEEEGCDARGYKCVILEANRVLDTDTRYTLWVDMYECTKAADSDNWNCFQH